MIGVIGGTGLTEPVFLQNLKILSVPTPFADLAVDVTTGTVNSHPAAFIARHGRGHKVPPHRINYRANLWALRQAGVSAVIGVNAVGGIHARTAPGALAVPNQIIDYTWGREHTFFADGLDAVTHIDFTQPYDEAMRQLLVRSAGNVEVWDGGVYACTQGPRLESAAEVRRLQGHDAVDVAAVIRTLTANAGNARALVANLPALLGPDRAPCPHGCDRALDMALMTAPDRRDPDLLAKLDAVAGRVLGTQA